jgi:tripartite-type tricarboxylate transporter receptor subunit TctC
MQDLLAGQVHMIFDNIPGALAQARPGKVRPLGVTSKERTPVVPDVPAIAETLPGYETYSWNALFAPAGTPPEIIKTLNSALREILADADVRKRLLDLGIEAKVSTPEELSDRLKSDIDKWGKVIEKAGIEKQ